MIDKSKIPFEMKDRMLELYAQLYNAQFEHSLDEAQIIVSDVLESMKFEFILG